MKEKSNIKKIAERYAPSHTHLSCHRCNTWMLAINADKKHLCWLCGRKMIVSQK